MPERDPGTDTTAPPEAPSSSPEARGERVGRYVIVDKIGEGGMGVVYSAYDDELDRAIAVKLIKHRGGAGAADARLVREARALARLQHPNVVAIHDAQSTGDAVYLAMELVKGADLRAWRAAGPRSTGEVLDVFVQAGRGLAAAHAAGLVHRDFKPANVLVGEDGRVRVADFGLAHPEAEGDVPAPAADHPLDPWMTRTGELVGTPAYMAPEQLRRRAATAASDQFSFCVALHEALCGARPFSVEDLLAGAPPAPPCPALPAWLRAVLVRGLALRERDRFPSMDALLAALDRTAAARHRLILAAGGALAGLALALTAVALIWTGWRGHGGRAATCAGASTIVAGTWGDRERARLRDAFLATGVPFAETSATAAVAALDRYAERWAAEHTAACEATRVRGEQPEGVLALRMACLERRRQTLAATVKVLVGADDRLVENAARAASALPALDGCADTASLLARTPPPEDPATRERIAALQDRLAEVEALVVAGKYPEALAAVTRIAEEGAPLAYPPLLAETHLWRARALVEIAQDDKAAEQALYDAIYAGEAGRHEQVVAEAWIDLLWVVGVRLRRAEEIDRLGRLADAALTKLGDPDVLRGRYWQYLAAAAAHARRTEEMDAAYARSIAAFERAHPPDHPDLLDARFNVASSAQRHGRAADSLPVFEELLPRYQRAFGPDHPHTARIHYAIGTALAALGRPADAVAPLSQALTLRERALGADHRDVANALSALGDSYMKLGRRQEAAAALTRALAIREKDPRTRPGDLEALREKLKSLP